MLQVIGAGFGRKGTLSLKVALEHLGFAPCYHMVEVFAHPGHVALWQAVGAGRPIDWEGLFGGYQAAVDAPACVYYEQLLQVYPEARVVLTVRDPQEWYESARSTIFSLEPDADGSALPPGFARMDELMMRRIFPEGVDDADRAMAAFERHNPPGRGGGRRRAWWGTGYGGAGRRSV